MKTYVLTIAKTFPVYHPNSGKPTHFAKRIEAALKPFDAAYDAIKRHTIRGNYPLWEKRFKEINAGRAILSVREWSGKPYKSKQITLYNLDHTDRIGIEAVEFFNKKQNFYATVFANDDNVTKDLSEIAHNDGLSTISFKEWFKMKNKYPSKETFTIIHFTGFRYVKN